MSTLPESEKQIMILSPPTQKEQKRPPVTRPPVVPTYVLRGHSSAITTLHFSRHNHYLLSGDSNGSVVVWSLSTKRPSAVWKAHDGGVMNIKPWGAERIVTQGRDHRLKVWQVKDSDLEQADTQILLPIDDPGEKWHPWLLHSMPIHSLNFCKFALCSATPNQQDDRPILIATPNGLDDGKIDLFSLPAEKRISQSQSNGKVKTGMVMALAIFHQDDTDTGGLMVVSGYESGHVMIHTLQIQLNTTEPCKWSLRAHCHPHSQPVLSLSITPCSAFIYTSSADAVVSKIAMPSTTNLLDTPPEKILNTRHSGQQDLSIRSDGLIFATAGWDGRVRVYSVKTLREIAVLKTDNSAGGCTAVAFADVDPAILDGNEVSSEDKAVQLADGESQGGLLQQQQQKKSAIQLIKEARREKAVRTHWLASAGKDGKISLWDVF